VFFKSFLIMASTVYRIRCREIPACGICGAIFLEQVVDPCQPQQELHIILDNLSAHKTKKVMAFLQEHPQVELHFTPTYSS